MRENNRELIAFRDVTTNVLFVGSPCWRRHEMNERKKMVIGVLLLNVK